MSQVSQNSMMWQASKGWSMLADTLGELSEPDMVSKLLNKTTMEMEEALSTISEGKMEQKETSMLAVRESQKLLEELALGQSPGEVGTALETIKFTISGEVKSMGTVMETLGESTSEGQIGSTEVNESSGDSEDADSRDQSNNSVHFVFSPSKHAIPVYPMLQSVTILYSKKHS